MVENLAEIIFQEILQFELSDKIITPTFDNSSNNNIFIEYLYSSLPLHFMCRGFSC